MTFRDVSASFLVGQLLPQQLPGLSAALHHLLQLLEKLPGLDASRPPFWSAAGQSLPAGTQSRSRFGAGSAWPSMPCPIGPLECNSAMHVIL